MPAKSSPPRLEIDAAPLIGVPSIDREHHELLGQLRRLIDDEKAHPRSAHFSETLSQLGLQISAHFDGEEAVLRACGMAAADVAAHVAAHCEILEQYADLNLGLLAGRHPSRAEALRMIRRWLVAHLHEHDLKIREHLAARKPQPA